MSARERKVRGDSHRKGQLGANLVEYMLLCMLIVVVAIVALRMVGYKISSKYSSVTSAMW